MGEARFTGKIKKWTFWQNPRREAGHRHGGKTHPTTPKPGLPAT